MPSRSVAIEFARGNVGAGHERTTLCDRITCRLLLPVLACTAHVASGRWALSMPSLLLQLLVCGLSRPFTSLLEHVIALMTLVLNVVGAALQLSLSVE